jgi:hypothetical protein
MSCSPRPYISRIRPSQSLFHLPTLIPLIGQALVHVIILSKGAKICSSLSAETSSRDQKSLSLRFPFIKSAFSSSEDITYSINRVVHERFRPNLLTNYVFILSIAQNTIIALTNQRGRPYQLDVLECRSVILWAFSSLLFCIILVTEEFPVLNRFLELAPWPNKKSQAVVLLLLALNSLTSLGFRFLARSPQRHSEFIRSDGIRHAADFEVQSLRSDRVANAQLICVSIFLLAFVILKGIL